MRALCGTPGGGLSSARLMDIEAPEPGSGEVRVRVEAVAINPADVKVLEWRDGGSFLHKKRTPLVVGYDLAGVVEKVGAGVTDRRVGDAVFGFVAYDTSTVLGSFAELVVVKSATLATRPAGWGAADAAAIATGGSTALQGLRDCAGLTVGVPRTPPARVLVNGASGGVGLMAVQIAKTTGAEVWGSCSAGKMPLVLGAGADHAVDYRESPVGTIKAEEALVPFDVVFDAASTSNYHESVPNLAAGGTYVTLLPGLPLVTGKIASLFSSRRCDFVLVKPRTADLDWLAASALSGALKVRIDATYPFSDIREALARFRTGAAAGKIVVVMEGVTPSATATP